MTRKNFSAAGPQAQPSTDPIGARIQYLKAELLNFNARIDGLEPPACAAQPATLPDCAPARALNEKLGWLGRKFGLSRAFPIFDAMLSADCGNSGLARDELWARYLAALELRSMQEVRDALEEAARLEETLPWEVREYFTPVSLFATYFLKVGECIEALSRVPESLWREIQEAGARPGSVFSRLFNKNFQSHRACLDLMHECAALGAELASAMDEAERRMRLVLSMAAALLPPRETRAESRPPRVRGALNSFISATPI